MATVGTGNTSLRFDPAPWNIADSRIGLRESAGAPVEVSLATRRRRDFTPRQQDPRASVALHDDEGVLRWVYEPPPSPAVRTRARRAGFFGMGEALARFEYEDIGPNRILEALVDLDRKLTPNHGLRRWKDNMLVPAEEPKITGRTLLLVHGTFSNSDMWFKQLGETKPGRDLLAELEKRYLGNILAFDHHTLSIAPWLNALDLQKQLRNVTGPIDIVCHSRGGLVVSWALRLAQIPAARVVFVGSPLAGTSLASPYRLRAMLDMMANVANALSVAGQAASTIFPLAAGAAGLAKVLGRTLSLGSTLPIADAAVALVPGLASQQRIIDHPESQRLFSERWLSQPAFSAVTADFEPNVDEPAWKFWTRFRNPGLQLANLGADVLFPGANDLVVDTDSMTYLGDPPQGKPDVLRLGKSATTHHTSYFQDPKVIAFLAAKLA